MDQIRLRTIWVHCQKIGKNDIKKDVFILSIIKLELLNGRIQEHKGKRYMKIKHIPIEEAQTVDQKIIYYLDDSQKHHCPTTGI